MRVFIGLKEISGYNLSLKRGFEALGVEAVFVNLFGSRFDYDEAPPVNLLTRSAASATRRRYHADRTRRLWRARWTFWLCLESLLRLALMLWAVPRFDVFVFAADSSFLFEFADLPLLRLLGKTVICVEHGSDVRPPYINGAVMRYPTPKSASDCLRLTRKAYRRARTVERYATCVVAIRSIGHFFTKPYIDFSRIGLPRSRTSGLMPDDPNPPDDSTIRIAHAPSRPISKGTPEIEALIADLQAQGCSIELVTLVNRPNADVWRELARCDFVVDQLYTDCFMGAFSVEAALMGKPSLAGSYALDSLRAGFPAGLIPPALLCPPSALRPALERLINDEPYRRRLGEDARRFAETTWSPEAVAARFLALAEGRAPDEWYFDPNSITYLYGNGQSEAQTRQFVAEALALGGRAALMLGDKPALEQAFVDFAAGKAD